MSIVFMDSANLGDVAQRWHTSALGNAAGQSPSGRNAYRAGNGSGDGNIFYFPTPVATAKISFYAKNSTVVASGDGGHWPIGFFGPTRTVHTAFLIQDGKFVMRRGGNTGANVAESSVIIFPDTHHHFEIWVEIADSGGRAVAYVDGVLAFDYTGDTRNGGSDTTVGSVSIRRSGGSFDVSDIVICDDNEIIGPSIVWDHLPNGPGNTTGLTRNTGATNWQAVDEASPDGDTTYVASVTEGDYDLYTMTDLPEGSVWEVLAVQTSMSAKTLYGGKKAIRPVIRSDGAEAVGQTKVLATGYRMSYEIFDENPVTEAPWGMSEINEIEVGPEVRDI